MTAAEVLADNATTTVSTGGTDAPASGTVQSWTVASSAPFPAITSGVTQFHVSDPAAPTEQILVTAIAGTGWTVTRGADSTTPVPHASGFTINLVIPAPFLNSPVFSGPVATAGLPGATAASRYAGATAGGAPASGTFATGDWVIDQTGKVWICTAGGTPGTWAAAGPTIPVTIAQGGTGQTAAAAALAALGGAAVAGDLGNTSAAPQVTGTHLTAPLPLTQGGTGQASQQAAMDALAGAQTAGQFLRGSGTHVQMSAIQAGDVPQLSQYNPVGLTGATTPTSYAGGTVSGHPLSGTWSQGQWVVDETGKIYVCVTGGTPGTWRRVGANAHQFFLDDYCKADVQQALVTVVSGNATINTTPLAAPSAPTLANTGSGGSLTAGTYQVKLTYTNRWGETVASSSASIAISGTEPLTISAPAPSGNATGWYCYCTQPGGSTYTRQQAAGSPSAMGVALVLTTTPTSSGANPPGSDTSAAQVFAAGDVGKNIMICGALAAIGGPWIDTIATYNSATSVTLSTASAAVNNSNLPMVFSSDDRLNVDQCITDATTYAMANDYFCQVIGGARGYGLGTGLFQSTPGNGTGTCTYNTAVRIPFGNPSGNTQKLEFQLLGPGDQDHEAFWMSQYANISGCAFVSYSVGPNGSPDATYGQQSVIGGPTGGFASGSNGFANVKAVIQGVQSWQPGWSNSIGVDLVGVASLRVRASAFGFAPASSLGGGANPYSNWPSQAFWVANKIGAGLRLPASGANQDSIVESFAAGGLNTGIVSSADGTIINNAICISCDVAVKLNLGSSTHDLVINRLYFENCNGGILQPGGGGNVGVYVTMDGENAALTGFDVKDVGSQLSGIIRWRDAFRTAGGLASIAAPSVSGAPNLEIINDQIARAVYDAHAYTYTLGTAFQNPWWRHMMVTIAGGTVTGISIGPTAGSLTSLGITSGTFRLPSGWWIDIAGSVKPTTFIGVPD